MSLRNVLFCSALAASLIACDGEMPDTDGGIDAGADVDAGQPLACTSVTQLTGVIDDTVSVTFDTRMTETRPRDLGLACGNNEAELRWAPQEVVEFIVPGDPGTTYAVDFTTNLPGTDMAFNTVIQARVACDTVPAGAFPPRCFDDVAATEFRSTGAITVPGGTTLFFLVTGFSEPPADQMTVDSGTVEVGFTIRGAQAPTVTGGFLRLANDDVRLQATGFDPNANVRGVGINFFGPDGELLDIYGDGEATEEGDVFPVRFDDPVATGTDYTGGAWVRGADSNLGRYMRSVGVTRVRFRVFDAAWGLSDPFDVDVEEATLVGLGEMCDSETFCREEMVCSGGVCIPGSAIGRLCDGATDLVTTATDNMGASVTFMGASPAGLGEIAIPTDCVSNGDPNGGIGGEAVYKVDVGVANFDMTISTDNPGTGDTDTIMYVRSSCPDSGSVIACSDDIPPMNIHTEIALTDLTAGTYYVFVETYRGRMSTPAPHEISVEITSITPSGQICDAATTRCAGGPCPAGGMCP